MPRRSPEKGRSSITYTHKIEQLKKWHSKETKRRAELFEKVEAIKNKKTRTLADDKILKRARKTKELKPLKEYVEKIKGSNGDKR
jgi:hypothetical protein